MSLDTIFQVVVSIRGTLSMKDVMTDLNAEGEVLPLSPPREDWLAHKGMVQAAEYIRKKLHEEGIIDKAFAKVSLISCSSVMFLIIQIKLSFDKLKVFVYENLFTA